MLSRDSHIAELRNRDINEVETDLYCRDSAIVKNWDVEVFMLTMATVTLIFDRYNVFAIPNGTIETSSQTAEI